ncbi:ABC transporter permease [Staphylococcus lutrae]|uniref:Sodium ABC transporter permease n=1 Tax=Staphylococcus lutrae TaxID=155085 RepID=A0AAC9WJ14_9STAP|nr:ABC transporter permease [Staphylococcus lutrae]ARJ50493.1 sodium ABC transporter permease [Staphylococcus lutrae]PNZ37394.1 ABC transporter permease [Staphylococcus lutrae]
MKKFNATLRFTYLNKVKTRGFVINTILMVLAITVIMNLDTIIKFFNNDEENVAIVTNNQRLYQQLEGQLKVVDNKIHYQNLSEKEAKAKVKNDELDRAYVIHEGQQRTLSATIISKSNPSEENKGTLQSILTQIQVQQVTQSLGLNGDDLKKIQSQSQVDHTIIQSDDHHGLTISDEEQQHALTIVFAGITLMFFIIFNYAQQIASEMATEKTSRVSEMIITSVQPTYHILAKIAAILCVAFTQIFILGVTFVANYFIFNSKSNTGSIQLWGTPHVERLIVFGVIFLIIGVLTYVILAAILGNMTARIEDLAQSLMPMSFILILAFYSSIFGAQNPDHLYFKILSYVPFFSPFVTFLRLSLPTTSIMEGIIAVGIHIVLIFVLTFIATKSYKNSVLSFEKGWKNVLKRAFQRNHHA